MPEAKDTTAKGESLYRLWNTNIQDALTREKTYRPKAQKCVDLYEAKEPDSTPFAILYSNTETLVPAVYNSKPIPIVDRRYKDPDPIGKAVADVSTRTLKYLIDNESQDYDCFDDLMLAAVVDGLVTNRGLTRFKYATHDKGYECVYGEAVRWDKFFHGYARTWKKVPWIGFEWDMTEDEVRKNFPNIPVDFKNIDMSQDTREDSKSESTNELKGVKLVKVFEIWDKRTGKVMFFSACYTKGALREVEDPLGLSGFFPIPRPINFLRRITNLVPVPLYEFYRSQANELNELTRRLKAIVKAIKFRGAYNSAVEGIEKMLKADDNEMVPVDNVMSMPDGTGMDKLLWTVPVNELAQTAQALYMQREQVKQTIYEITGISDILRGASVASETATAQNIKNQWGTLRLKKMQKEVQRYVRDSLAIMLEIASNHFEMNTFMQMTGAPYLMDEQKQQVQLKQQMAAMPPPIPMGPPMGQPGQSPGGPLAPGAPPMGQLLGPQAQGPMPMMGPPAAPQPPPPLPPEIELLMAHPSWEEIYKLLQNELLRSYKVDIETNSTIDAEAAQDKQDIAELMTAISQFLQGVSPLVQEGVLSIDVAKAMLLVITRRFNFGPQIEEAIQAMKPPEPQPDPKAAAEMEATKAEMAMKQQDFQQKTQLAQMQFANEQKKLEMQAQLDMLELKIKEAELQLQEKALGLKLQQQTMAHNQKMEQMAMQKTMPQKAPAKESSDASV